MYRIICRLLEEAVAKVERKCPESDRQAFETLAVQTGFSYWFSLVVQVPCMQASFSTVGNGFLYLREGYAGYSVVDIAVVVRQIE